MFFRLRSYCFLICVLMVSSARAGFILQIDLSTVNQVTISATTGVSLASVSGQDGEGVYLKDFLGTRVFTDQPISQDIGGNLSYFKSDTDGLPNLQRFAENDSGLNIWGLSHEPATPGVFTAGVQAFRGSSTFSLTASQYDVFLLAPKTGGIFAFLTSSNSNMGGEVIGQYEVSDVSTVPEPTSMAIFGLGAAGMGYLARRKRKA